MTERTYLVIDLKSFYASVECVSRGLDPLTTKLVVADPERTDKTICLAVSPALKELGVKNRCRVFEIPKNIEYIMASPRMAKYIEISAEIYGVYLQFIAKEDIHVYSIDEAFLDVTNYLHLYSTTPQKLGKRIIKRIYEETGITATCGIGTNMYLAKVALDIVAKHAIDNIGILNEARYQKTLWDHKPITDFWRVGAGIAARLETLGIKTMRQITEIEEDRLYKLLGIDAELLIDHAWGKESCTIADIKKFKPKNNCLGTGQVLGRSYTHDKAKIVVKEMVEQLSLELVDKGLITEAINLVLGYDKTEEEEGARGTIRMPIANSSSKMIMEYTDKLFERIHKSNALIHRINITFLDVIDEAYQQVDLFTDTTALEEEKKIQKTLLKIKQKYGKNAVVKGMDLLEGATTQERNKQIGGHKA